MKYKNFKALSYDFINIQILKTKLNSGILLEFYKIQ